MRWNRGGRPRHGSRSELAYYVLHRIATTANLWQRWAQEDPQCAELRKVMAESGAWSMLATAMVENARAAALFMDHVSHHLHLCTTRSSCLAYLQSAVLETAFAYKNRNAASSLARASIILEALQYPFHRLTSLANGDLHFARQCGVLTDLATFQSCSDKKFKPVRFIVDGAVKYLAKQEGKRGRPSKKTEYVDEPTGMVLSTPAKALSRYEMSAAQLALCRIGYGVSPRAPTCDGFEGTVVDFVLFALLAGPPPPQSRLLYCATIMRSSCSTPRRRLTLLMSWCCCRGVAFSCSSANTTLQQDCPIPMPKLSMTKWDWRIPQCSCCKACVTTSFE